MATNGCRFSDFAFQRLFNLNASSGLIFASWQAFYAFVVVRFYDDFMESLFVAFSQIESDSQMMVANFDLDYLSYL